MSGPAAESSGTRERLRRGGRRALVYLGLVPEDPASDPPTPREQIVASVPILVFVGLFVALSAYLRDLRTSLVVGITYAAISLVVSCLRSGPSGVPGRSRRRLSVAGPLMVLVVGGLMGLSLFGLSHIFSS